jgi:glycosyltransferase involved in cell wall biosynthesis
MGRTSPAKGFLTIIDAVKVARSHGHDVKLTIVGPSSTNVERAHRRVLIDRVRFNELQESVEFQDGVPRHQVLELIRGTHALVNAMVSGSGDKVVFEAMATGRPPLASNHCFARTLSGLRPTLLFAEGDAADLAERIGSLAALTTFELADLGSELRRRVVQGHSLDGWADSVVRVIGSPGKENRTSRSGRQPERLA